MTNQKSQVAFSLSFHSFNMNYMHTSYHHLTPPSLIAPPHPTIQYHSPPIRTMQVIFPWTKYVGPIHLLMHDIKTMNAFGKIMCHNKK